MQVIHAEQLLAQAHIFVHGRQVFAHSGDQIVIDFYRDFGLVKGGMQCRGIFPGIRKKLQLLHLTGQHRR